jgi:hypothetical protein
VLIAPLDQFQQLADHWLWLGFSERESWSIYALFVFLITTPVWTLILMLWGGIGSVRRSWRSRDPSFILIWLWLLVPLVRASMPHMQIYDGIRHLLEILPPMAILAGLGLSEAAWILERSLFRAHSRIWPGALAAVFLVPQILPMIGLHPYEITFHNRLIGGLPGAQAIGLADATDYWGSSYRRGFEWLDQHALEGECVYMPPGQLHNAETVHGLWLRADLRLVGLEGHACPRVYAMHTTRASEYTNVDLYAREHLEPIYRISIDSAPIMQIFELSKQQWDSIWAEDGS